MNFKTENILPETDMSEHVETLITSLGNEEDVRRNISAKGASRDKTYSPEQRTDSENPEEEESPGPVPFSKLYRFSTVGERFALALGLVAGLGEAATEPINDLLFGGFITTAVHYGTALANATASGTTVSEEEATSFLDGAKKYVIYWCIMGVINCLLSYISIFTFNCVAHRQIYRIRELYLKSALQQDMAWYDVHQSGDFASRMSGNLSKLEEGIGEKVVQCACSLAGYAGCVAVSLWRGWELAAVCLAALPLCVGSLIATDLCSSRLADQEADMEAEAGAVAQQAFAAIRTVVAFQGQHIEVDRYSENLQAAVNISKRKTLVNGLNEAVGWISMFGGYALAFWYGVELIIRDRDLPEEQRTYDAGTMIAIFYSVMEGTWVFSGVTSQFEAFSTARGAAAKVFAVIDRESRINSLTEQGETPLYARGDVTFRDAHFEYPSRPGVKILKGLNLKIKAGETVALVGSSGCGKSTCIRLIQRFYDPLLGSVELDGRDLRSLNVGWLRSQIGVVGQEPVLFQTSIAENIRYGREGCTMEEIEEAAKMANAHGFISKLPQGYDTLVGERGAQLSGGQKQRIAIARALVRRPKILLLDEATSALDTGSEAKVQAALDRVLSHPDPAVVRSQTYWYCAVFIIIAVVMGVSSFLQTYTFKVAGDLLTSRLRRLAFSAMLRQEVSWFDDKNNSTGALCARLSADTADVQGATGQPINSVVQAVATLALTVGVCVYYEWRLGLLAVALMPVLLAADHYDAVVEEAGDERMRKAVEQATKVAVEAVGNLGTVAALCRERALLGQYVQQLRPALRVAERTAHARAAVFSLSRNIGAFTYAACVYYGATLVHGDAVPYQVVFKVAEALMLGTGTISSALSCMPAIRKGLRSASRLFSLLERRPLVTDPQDPTDDTLTSEGEVRYSDVEFSYPTRPDAVVLKGLNLLARPGQTVALVGPSGCGKSTCIQLLERFYDPNSGTVSLDAQDVSKVRLSSLRSKLGLVQQEPVLFDRTIGENIAYGDNSREVPMDEIIDVAKKANIHNFIETLPQGYQTLVGDKGAQLSGGQKQRVAIARALLRDPSVLILDEATSALDSDSEKVVQEALNNAKEGRTCVTIAHRLSTVQDADVICVISNGKVAEMGSHAELLAKRGVYYKLQCLLPT